MKRVGRSVKFSFNLSRSPFFSPKQLNYKQTLTVTIFIIACLAMSVYASTTTTPKPAKSHGHKPVKPFPQNEWFFPGFHLTNGNIDLLFSGQVNQAILYMNDGARRRVFYGDNDVSASAIRFTTVAKLDDCFNIFSIIEIGIQDQSTRLVSQLNPQPGLNLTLRIGEVGAESKCYGKLSLGQGYTATDYTAEVDLSGVDVVLNSAIQKLGGNIIFADRSDGSLAGNPAIQNGFDNLDGLNRRTRLRYDTPSMEGWILSGSVIERANADVAIRYSNDFKPFKFAGALGYASSSVILDQNDVPGRNLDGSASLIFTDTPLKGLNFTFASGEIFARDRGRDNPVYYYGKLGYQFDCFWVGTTNFAIDYGYFRDFDENGDRGRVYGGAIVQTLKPWKSDIYLAARRFNLNRSDERFYPITLFVGGMRVAF